MFTIVGELVLVRPVFGTGAGDGFRHWCGR